MTRIPFRALAIPTLLLGTVALAHVDDPKEKYLQPAYVGPGWQAGSADSAHGFPAVGVELMAWLPVSDFGYSGGASDCWGYTSPSGREYALLGIRDGATGFADITDPANPVIIGSVAGASSTWQDIKVFGTHAYHVTESSSSGVQVIDLSDIDNGNVTLVNTIMTGGTGKSHNVAIDETSGFMYRCGGSSNGLRIYDLNADPVDPPFVASWDLRYVHDAQIVTYTDGPFAGRQIAFCCSGYNGGGTETGMDILDVTDKSNIQILPRVLYPMPAYSHQVWLSADRHYAYLNDEADEGDYGIPTTTIVVDVSDVEAAMVVSSFTNGDAAIGHNLYVRDNLVFEANYTSGLRVFDIGPDPEDPVEVAYFDTRPDESGTIFTGLWSNFPFYPSGTIIGSDTVNGLFVWRMEQSCSPDPDTNGDGYVDVMDLLNVLAEWACEGEPGQCIGDTNCDGIVNVEDLLDVLAHWSF